MRTKVRGRAVWLSRVLALLVAVVCFISNVAIDPTCLLAADVAGDPCDDDRGPCPCPLDCASCACVRAVPTPAEAALSIPPPPPVEGSVPKIDVQRRPSSPEPDEISHVPKA